MNIIKNYFKQDIKNQIEQCLENQKRAGWLISAIEKISNYTVYAEDIAYKAFSQLDDLTNDEKELVIKAIELIKKDQDKEK